jgi:hypothetical protein
MNQARFELMPVGWVESPLTDRASAPKQGFEGAPEAWLVFEPWVLQGFEGIRAGSAVALSALTFVALLAYYNLLGFRF